MDRNSTQAYSLRTDQSLDAQQEELYSHGDGGVGQVDTASVHVELSAEQMSQQALLGPTSGLMQDRSRHSCCNSSISSCSNCRFSDNNNNSSSKQICIAPKVVTSKALRPGSVLVSRERRESLGEEECL